MKVLEAHGVYLDLLKWELTYKGLVTPVNSLTKDAVKHLIDKANANDIYPDQDDWAEIGPYRLNVQLCAMYRDNEVVFRPTRLQSKFLHLLIKKDGSVVSKVLAMGHLYPMDTPETTKIIDVHICNIRKALRERGLELEIGTIWGIGHVLRYAPKGKTE